MAIRWEIFSHRAFIRRRRRWLRNRASSLLFPAKDKGGINVYIGPGAHHPHDQIVDLGTQGHLRAIQLGGATGLYTLKNGSPNSSGTILLPLFVRHKFTGGYSSGASGDNHARRSAFGGRARGDVGMEMMELPGNGIPFDNGLSIKYSSMQSGPQKSGEVVIHYEVDEI
jgi:hypothetical protein